METSNKVFRRIFNASDKSKRIIPAVLEKKEGSETNEIQQDPDGRVQGES